MVNYNLVIISNQTNTFRKIISYIKKMIISKQQMGIIKLKKHEIHINQEVSAHGKRRRNTTFNH